VPRLVARVYVSGALRGSLPPARESHEARRNLTKSPRNRGWRSRGADATSTPAAPAPRGVFVKMAEKAIRVSGHSGRGSRSAEPRSLPSLPASGRASGALPGDGTLRLPNDDPKRGLQRFIYPVPGSRSPREARTARRESPVQPVQTATSTDLCGDGARCPWSSNTVHDSSGLTLTRSRR
jgi:hypothetical protein